MNLGGGVRLVHTKVGQSLVLAGPPLTLIDTGRPGSVPRIERSLARLGKRIEDLEQVVITHPHHDHIGAAAEIARLSDARFFVHHADAAVARGEAPPYQLGDTGAAAAMTRPFRARLIGWTHFSPVEIHGLLQDGQKMDPGIEIIGTPGHTPGHISVLIPSIQLLHVGDALWNVVRLDVAPVMFNFDEGQAARSVKKLAEMGGYRRATFGHGPPMLRGAPRRIARAARRYRT